MRRIDAFEFTEFEWDEAKRQEILVNREIDLPQVAGALLQPHLEESSDKHGEARTLAICMIGMQFVRVIYTRRGDVCRIITAMAARRDERRTYREIFGG